MTAVARRTSPLVAIFNSRDEVIEAIRSALENDGFETVTARLAEIQNGTLDLVAFIKVHDPDVIVYDLPRPYENHWNFLRLMKETTSLKDRMWILTTTDKEALEAAVGASDVVEIIVGQPYGPDDVVDAGGEGRLLADRAGSRATAGARWHHPRRRPHQLHRPRTPRERAASFAFICQERERTRAKVPPSKIRTS